MIRKQLESVLGVKVDEYKDFIRAQVLHCSQDQEQRRMIIAGALVVSCRFAVTPRRTD